MNKAYSIVRAEVQHAQEACKVLRRSISEVCAADYNNDAAILDEWLSNKTVENVASWIASSKTHAVVALDHNHVVGIGMASVAGEILLLYVLPEHMRKGVGKLLLQTIEDTLSCSGVTYSITVSSITAKAFYERNGYIKNAEPIYVGGIQGDFPMKKKLGAL